MHAMYAAGEQNSAGFRELQDEVVRLKTVVREVDDTIDAFAQKDAKLLGIIGVATGITGAFTVAQSAIGLFGVKNAAVEKSLLAVANAINYSSTLIRASRAQTGVFAVSDLPQPLRIKVKDLGNITILSNPGYPSYYE